MTHSASLHSGTEQAATTDCPGTARCLGRHTWGFWAGS